jgi:transketolase
MSANKDYRELEALARRGRWLAISTVAKSGAGHVGGPFSAMDLLIALYIRKTRVGPSGIDSFFLRDILRLDSTL